ncbi:MULTISPECIES: redoxin domain-containing protein [unclassified Schlesneria]|uniref:redoxin domain-containing protein n=1 Tax=unclassified Schlesneria TaxID=2762017 RepID=UPI002EF86EC0
MKDWRLGLVLFLGVVIAIVSAARIVTDKPHSYEEQVAAATIMRPAAGFDALDSDSHLVRLNSWLGRHRIIVVFFDGEAGADQDTNLLRLRDRYAELQALDVKVVGVTAAIPQENRAAMERAGGKFPFPVVSDIDPQSPEGTLRIHRRWGRLNPANDKTLPGVFLIDRRGMVAHLGPVPKPENDIDQLIQSLAKK